MPNQKDSEFPKSAPNRELALEGRSSTRTARAGRVGSSSRSSTVVRPDVTRGEIVDHLRGRITSGDLTPGSRLPTYRALQSSLQANMVTVSRAIDQLKGEGFIDTQGARGTFVVNHPPHLFRYALVFPSHPSESNWPRFWEALAKEAATIEREGPCEMPVYYDVDQFAHQGGDWYTKLLEDMRAHRFAGLIFAADPWVVRDTPLVTEPGMPYVSITSPQPALYPNIATVDLDTVGLVEKALDYLVARGRKRLAVLSHSDNLDQLEPVKLAAQQRGMEMRSYWTQSATPSAPKSAQACMNLLMRLPADDRPNALFVTDDNLVEYATAGLVDAGVRFPQDMEVVAHCNFPWPTPVVVPVKRIGFDARRCLRACVQSIDHQRRGRGMPPPVAIPAVFEDEL